MTCHKLLVVHYFFSDNTKAYVPLNYVSDIYKLQYTIDYLVEWGEKWLLKYNNRKCKISRLGKKKVI